MVVWECGSGGLDIGGETRVASGLAAPRRLTGSHKFENDHCGSRGEGGCSKARL